MRVLLIGGCLGLGSLVAQALLERGIEVVEDDGSYHRSSNPHHVTADQIGLADDYNVALLSGQFDLRWEHSDLWRDRAVETWYDLHGNPVHRQTAGPSPVPASPLPHVRGTCMV